MSRPSQIPKDLREVLNKRVQAEEDFQRRLDAITSRSIEIIEDSSVEFGSPEAKLCIEMLKTAFDAQEASHQRLLSALDDLAALMESGNEEPGSA